MWAIFFVLAADELDQIGGRLQLEVLRRRGPRLCVGLRVVDGRDDFQITELRTADPLDDVERVAGGTSLLGVEPDLVVEPSGVDDERVAVPAAGRVSKPGGIHVRR